MFKKILVPLDRSSFAEQALGLAAVVARAAEAQIDLVLVHAPAPGGSSDVSRHIAEIGAERDYLGAVGDELTKSGGIATSYAVLVGDVVRMICDRAVSVGADLIVMTSHGRTGLRRSWIGSVANEVLRNSGVPVLLWRATDIAGNPVLPFMPIRQILLPVDGSDFSKGIIQTAADISTCTGARICMLRVVQPVTVPAAETETALTFPLVAHGKAGTARVPASIKRELSEAARALAVETGRRVDSHVIVASDVADAIVKFALDGRYDAIAMSTHGRGASRLIFGSVADKVMHSAGLPMILRRPAASAKQAGSTGASRKRRHVSTSAG